MHVSVHLKIRLHGNTLWRVYLAGLLVVNKKWLAFKGFLKQKAVTRSAYFIIYYV